MGDFDKPVKTDGYEALLDYIRALFADVGTWADSNRTSPTNMPEYTKRWDASNDKIQSYEAFNWVTKLLSVAGGGTGSSSASGARANLEVDSSTEVTAKVVAHNAVTSPLSASSDALAIRLIIRDTSSRARVAPPIVSNDIATKGYVDAMEPFASGTSMLFNQAAAPSGWTKKADWAHVAALHVGNDYATGGVDNPRSYTTGISVADHANHVHSGPNHQHTGPLHNHSVLVPKTGWGVSGGSLDGTMSVSAADARTYSPSASRTLTSSNAGNAVTGYSGTGNTGAGGAASHSIAQSTYKPQFVQVIAAIKD